MVINSNSHANAFSTTIVHPTIVGFRNLVVEVPKKCVDMSTLFHATHIGVGSTF